MLLAKRFPANNQMWSFGLKIYKVAVTKKLKWGILWSFVYLWKHNIILA